MKREAYTYCSFCGDEGFRGALILRGDLNPLQAVKRSWDLGLNPGGEMIVASFEPSQVPEPERSLYLANIETRLLTEEELRTAGCLSAREHEQNELN